jgi:hypothetical protein
MSKKLLPISIGIIAYIAAFYFATIAGIPKDKQPALFLAMLSVSLLESMIGFVVLDD